MAMKTLTAIREGQIDRVVRHVQELADSGRPIVVGPWLGEIGFEVLYWIPFLRWVLKKVPIPADRVTVLSRGGCASWYGDLAAHYAELYDRYTPIELRSVNTQRIEDQTRVAGRRCLKQYHVTDWEWNEVAQVNPDAVMLHPTLMYSQFRYFWRRRINDLYARCARPKRVKAPPRPSWLPSSYVAVKWYSAPQCQQCEEHQQVIDTVMAQLTAAGPVVVLETGTQYDNHGSFAMTGNVIRPVLQPTTNLAVQTAVIAHADAYVGTYGGFAYLAPFLGTPATTCYGGENFRRDHYDVMQQVARKFAVPFRVVPLDRALRTVPKAYAA